MQQSRESDFSGQVKLATILLDHCRCDSRLRSGSTYASGSYQQQLKNNALVYSMSGKSEYLDNAVAESFFGTLKNELVYDEDYQTRAQAKQSIFKYIEVFLWS